MGTGTKWRQSKFCSWSKSMVNKKGFLRILEAIIAIVLILGLIFYLTPRSMSEKGKIPRNIEELQQFVLKEVSYNATFRDCTLASDIGSCKVSYGCRANINRFIDNSVPNDYDYEVEICKTSVSCFDGELPISKSVFADSSFIGDENSRVFRIYIWEK